MPICVNPKCGKITQTMSLYCPSCGQQSLSRIDRGQVEAPHSPEISMENFDRITKDVPAKRETPYGLPKSKKQRRKPKKLLRPTFKFAPQLKSRKAFWAAMVVAAIGLYFVAQANPSLMPQPINDGVSAVKRVVVQVLPHSDAYQLGFDEGSTAENMGVFVCR